MTPDVQRDGVPAPIVALNRWTIVAGVVLAAALREPWITTLLFVVVASAAVCGRRGSLVIWAGSRWLRPSSAAARAAGDTEDAVLTRFNNALAAVMLGIAQLAFLDQLWIAGWALSVLTAAAAAIALAGYCVGCTLFYQVKSFRFRILGS